MKAILNAAALEALARTRVFFSTDGRPRLAVGQKVEFDAAAWMEPYSAILGGASLPTIGSFSYTFSPLPVGAEIGRYCSISMGVAVMGGNHPIDFVSTSSFSYDDQFSIFTACLEDFGVEALPRRQSAFVKGKGKLIIGNDVWIGQSVLLARGVSVGDGAVIGAGSVVTKPVPPYAIVAGNPARLIRMRFPDRLVERLLGLEWWRYKFTDFATLSYHQPDRFAGELEDEIAAGRIRPYEPVRLLLRELF
jgi:acetyltransferase-like isoleucine patch superfamily enzyme